METLPDTHILNVLGKMFIHVDSNEKIIEVDPETLKNLGLNLIEIKGEVYTNYFRIENRDGELFSEVQLSNSENEINAKNTRVISWHKSELESGFIYLGEEISGNENFLVTLHKLSSLLLELKDKVPYREFVKLIGEAANSDHTYIFINEPDSEGDLVGTKIAEWGRHKFIDNEEMLPGLNKLKIRDFSDEYVETLQRGEAINLRISCFKDWEKRFFSDWNIQAILIIPIMVKQEFFGFVGFDNRNQPRKWTSSEIQFLKAAIKNLEQSIIRSRVLSNLKASEARFKKLSSLTTEGIIIHDKGVIKEANQTYLDLIKYSREEIVGENVIDKIALPEYQELIYEQVKKKNPLPYEIQAKRKDGVVVPFELEARSIIYNNETLRVVAVRDIIERKRVEEELIKQKNKAEESNRLKTQFLNNMSHEIRTPLNGIIGFTQFLNDPHLSEDQRQYFVNIIQSSSDQLLRVIDDIIEISKLETKQVKVIKNEMNLNSVLLEIFSIFELKTKEKNISLLLNNGLSDRESEIITDKLKLQKVLNNLVENAVKFTHTGEIEIGYNKVGDFLEIWVSDTGIGIPEENLKVIFERFSQVESTNKAVYGGLGLGLSIAKENTELLGGEIIVKSNENSGAKFTMKLPYDPVHSPTEEKMKNAGSEPRFRILIAEDEEVNFILLEFLIKGLAHSVEILKVRNGAEAVTVFKENRDVDLILMDLKMPILNGYEATKQIRELDNNVPIIAITAYSSDKDRKETLLRGFTDFLTKPVLAEPFSDTCMKYLVKRINPTF